MSRLIVPVDACFSEIAGAARARLEVSHPDLSFEIEGDKLIVSGDEVEDRASQLKKSVLNTLYQEKVFQETLEIRKRIYNG
ncbi:hypothetical protein C1J05_09995 [Sulfitobacter sp. JL08]|nr:hypothetical protein C1J05_09995 [Sulfitobacter sp. JL08]